MNVAERSLRIPADSVVLDAGALDTVVIELNRKAMQELSGEARLEIVTGASHLFEEPGRWSRSPGWPRAGSPST